VCVCVRVCACVLCMHMRVHAFICACLKMCMPAKRCVYDALFIPLEMIDPAVLFVRGNSSLRRASHPTWQLHRCPASFQRPSSPLDWSQPFPCFQSMQLCRNILSTSKLLQIIANAFTAFGLSSQYLVRVSQGCIRRNKNYNYRILYLSTVA